MTAPISPDENSQTPQNQTAHHSAFAEQPAFVYDDPNTIENHSYEQYVPEREFVLMPLFRRIGELLGIRHEEESEYTDRTESEPRPTARVAEPEPAAPALAPAVAHTANVSPVSNAFEPDEPSTVLEQSPLASSVEEIRAASEHVRVNPGTQAESAKPEALLEIRPEICEPVALQHQAYQTNEFAPQALASPIEARVEIEPAPVRATSLPPLVSRRETETSDPAASLRKAATKISEAISQAARWLHAQEEEVLRRAQAARSSMQPRSRVESYQPAPPATASSPLEAPGESSEQRRAAVPFWGPCEAPALQREMAWNKEPASEDAQSTRQSYTTAQRTTASAGGAGRRPQLVPTSPRLSFWKRIDWAQQFTAKRIAILGAAAMAIVLVTAISLAKRPASNDLPQQTRSIEPGGVTLSTHLPARVTPPSVAAQSRATAPRRSAAPRSVRRRAGNADGPEVVTHYYNRKPSPVKQSTVAGVRHYSDIP